MMPIQFFVFMEDGAGGKHGLISCGIMEKNTELLRRICEDMG